jgi:hypothetical protein
MAMHYSDEGPVHASFEYLRKVVAAKTIPIRLLPSAYAELWALTDRGLRVARAQAWLYNNRGDDDIAAHVIENERDATVTVLAANPSSHGLLRDFAHTEMMQFFDTWLGVNVDQLGAASQPRLIAPGLEIVHLINTDGQVVRVEADTMVETVATFVMHHSDEGWLLASHTDFIPEPGWPRSSSGLNDRGTRCRGPCR